MREFFLFFLFFTSLCNANACAANEFKHKLTINQARLLVSEALTYRQKHLPGLDVGRSATNPPYYDSYFPRFIIFNVIWNGPQRGGSFESGFYAVDPYTGDVFNAITSDCEGYKSKNLQKLQARYRNNILHLTQDKYNKLKTKGPMCDE